MRICWEEGIDKRSLDRNIPDISDKQQERNEGFIRGGLGRRGLGRRECSVPRHIGHCIPLQGSGLSVRVK